MNIFILLKGNYVRYIQYTSILASLEQCCCCCVCFVFCEYMTLQHDIF